MRLRNDNYRTAIEWSRHLIPGQKSISNGGDYYSQSIFSLQVAIKAADLRDSKVVGTMAHTAHVNFDEYRTFELAFVASATLIQVYANESFVESKLFWFFYLFLLLFFSTLRFQSDPCPLTSFYLMSIGFDE